MVTAGVELVDGRAFDSMIFILRKENIQTNIPKS